MIEISHPEKLYYPQADVSKEDLVRYYEEISERMLPLIAGRPLMLRRFPEGVEEDSFYQKVAPEYYPEYIERIAVKHSTGVKQYASANNPESLQYLASHGALEIHIWLSTKESIRKPDQLVLDFDPSSNDQFATVQKGAAMAKQILEALGAKVLVKITGSRGLHVTVPLKPEADFKQVRDFAKHIGHVLAKKHPDLFTIETRKNKRGERVLVDYWRNGYAQTMIAPYSVRARDRPTVAAPITWKQALDQDFRPDQFTIEDVGILVKKDPWKGGWENPPTLGQLLAKL